MTTEWNQITISLLLKLLLILLFSTLIYLSKTLPSFRLKVSPVIGPTSSPREYDNNGMKYAVYNNGCKLIEIDPFDKSISRFWQGNRTLVHCMPSKTRLANQTLAFDITDPDKLERCCYRVISRVEQQFGNHDKNADWKIKYSDMCHPINSSAGCFIASDEFLRVDCQNARNDAKSSTDFHGQVVHPVLKSNTTRNKAKFYETLKEKGIDNPPSVLIIGIDSVSRLQMIRSMPQTRWLLQQNNFTELKGYTKVGVNTFPNVMASLTGKRPNDTKCGSGSPLVFDSCPFIWKNYSRLNYMTGLFEDAPGIGAFNYFKGGFLRSPVDYYIRPLTVAMHKFHGRSHGSGEVSCVGGLSPTDFMAQYVKDFLLTMGNQFPFFLHAWFTSISHADMHLLKTADDTFRQLLATALDDTSANPENTLIVFMSDHGVRFGGFRKTFHGFYEESLPFVFIRLPSRVKRRFLNWEGNLRRNARQLTTPLDLYKTFESVLNYGVQSKIYTFKISTSAKPVYKESYSLFEHIPDNRTCQSALIPERFCMCGVTPPTDQMRSPQSSWKIKKKVIQNLNNQLKDEIKSGNCVKLSFGKYLYSKEIGSGALRKKIGRFVAYKDYLYAFEVKESRGQFESKIRVFDNSVVEVIGAISRLNTYGNQSHCVGHWKLKPFCMCALVLRNMTMKVRKQFKNK